MIAPIDPDTQCSQNSHATHEWQKRWCDDSEAVYVAFDTAVAPLMPQDALG